jgi:hypothetical protein
MKKAITTIATLLAAGLCSFGQYYPEVHVKGAVADGEIAVFDGVDGKYIRAGGTNAEAVLRTMTNYLPVASSSNWLVYNPLTRTLTGCVTNKNTGPQGIQGPAGSNGVNGVNGTNGVDGAPGTNGLAATIAVAWVSNGVPGSSVIVTNVGDSNNALFGFVIPAGSNGVAGADGSNGVNGVNGTNGVDGAPGTNGLAATIAVAWVSNGVPGSSVIVTNVGDSNNALFGFVIPAGSNGVSDLSSTQIVTRIVTFSGVDFDALVGTNSPEDLYQFSLTIATNPGFTGTTVSVQSTNPASWSYWNGATVEPMQTGQLPHLYFNSYQANVSYTWTNSVRGNTYYCRGYVIKSAELSVVNIINKILEAK